MMLRWISTAHEPTVTRRNLKTSRRPIEGVMTTAGPRLRSKRTRCLARQARRRACPLADDDLVTGAIEARRLAVAVQGCGVGVIAERRAGRLEPGELLKEPGAQAATGAARRDLIGLLAAPRIARMPGREASEPSSLLDDQPTRARPEQVIRASTPNVWTKNSRQLRRPLDGLNRGRQRSHRATEDRSAACECRLLGWVRISEQQKRASSRRNALVSTPCWR